MQEKLNKPKQPDGSGNTNRSIGNDYSQKSHSFMTNEDMDILLNTMSGGQEHNYFKVKTGKNSPESGNIVFQPFFGDNTTAIQKKKDKQIGLDPIEMMNGQLKAMEKGCQPLQMFLNEEEEEQNIKAKTQGSFQKTEKPVKQGSTVTKTSIPKDVQSKMEGSFGTDFSGVNIHQNSEQATNIGALAHTQGDDVCFAPAQYNPNSQKGQELLGHELTHVVQQRQGRGKPTKQGKGMSVNDSPSLEQEADVMGRRAAEGKFVEIKSTSSNSIQKHEAIGATSEVKTNELEVFEITNDQIIIVFYTSEGITKDVYLKKSITYIRDYIIRNYNWNGIISIMKFLSNESTDFHYVVPTDLSGTISDDVKIIPDEGIFAIVEVQVNNNINGADITNENIQDIMDGVDGLPGDKFAEIMGEDDKNSIRNEGDNTNLLDEEGNEIEIPEFDSASEETLYDFFEDITKARNGLWSSAENITNVVGLRRAIDDNVTKYNDTMAVCWISKDGEEEVKNAKVYASTTEPGEIDDHRQLVPQTLTLELGYHKGRQPGGRTSQVLIQDKSNSDTVKYYSGDSTMNFHHGGNEGANISGMSTAGLSSDYISTGEKEFKANVLFIEAFRILTQWGNEKDIAAYEYLEDWKEAKKYVFSEIDNGKIKFKQFKSDVEIERDVDKIKDYIVGKYSGSNDDKDNFIRIIQSVDETFTQPENIYDLEREDLKNLIEDNHVQGILEKQMDYFKDDDGIDGMPGATYLDILDGELETFDYMHKKALTDFEYLRRVFKVLRKIFNDDDLTPILGEDTVEDKIDYLKNLKPGTITERGLYEGDNSITGENMDGSQTIEQDVDGWSEGCQVIFGSEKFYEFWGHVTDKALDSKQRRWYYTIINLETQETTTEETTE